jgi:protein-S-isoprenylcysteine O-methyltransferase Ste14
MNLFGAKDGKTYEDTGIRMIPPLIFLIALMVAWGLQRIIPIGFPLPVALRWLIGVPLIVLPFVLAPFLFAAFRRADSEYDVRKVPKGLVTDGAFRYSRNPGYATAVVFCVGMAFLFANPWVLICTIPAVVLVHYRVVLREEAVLEKAFGTGYLAYKQRVRRWL